MHRATLALTGSLLLLLPSGAHAQELRGTVRLDATEQPAAGVIIEARDPRSGERVANTLTDARGYFILRLPAPATVAVRGLRIGQRPTAFGTFALAADEIRTEQFTLSGVALTLERVTVIGRSVCGRRRTDDQQVLTLLEEARKAILSTQLRSADGEMSAIWSLRTRTHSLRGQPIGDPVRRVHQSSTDRPFQSLPADSLAKVGYFTPVEDGYVFYAPDAEVLLSDAFVEDHCFQTTPWTRDDRDWVGVGFRPAQTRRGIVGIQGTMWLDRANAELRLLEYDYVNLPSQMRTSLVGGEVGFLRVESGGWLVNRWDIRMPRLESRRLVGTFRSTPRLRSLEVTGGDVLEVRQGERTLFKAEGLAIPAPLRRAADVAELCTDPLGPREGLLWGVVRDSTGAPVPNASVGLDWRDEWRWLANDRKLWQTRRLDVQAGADGLWVACGITRDLPVTLRARAGEDESAPHTAWIPRDSLGLPVDVELGAPAERTTGTVFGRATDSLRTFGSWAGVTVQRLGGGERVAADTAGRFALAGLPPGEHAVAAWDDDLLFWRVPPPMAAVRVAADGSGEPALLTLPSPDSLFVQACGRRPGPNEGLLVGEVRNAAGARRAGVRVRASWERTRIAAGTSERDARTAEALTDAAGWFTLCGVPRDGEADRSGATVVYASGDIELSAAGDRIGAGPVVRRLDGAPIARRDLVVGLDSDRRRLTGTVMDLTGRRLADATVVLVGADSTLVARTGANGVWTLDGVPVRSVRLQVRALRYTPAVLEIDPVGGSFDVGEVRLAEAPQLLETVNIRGVPTNTSEAGFEERRRSYAFGEFFDEKSLKQQPTVTKEFITSRSQRMRVDQFRKITLELPGSGFQAMTQCYPRWFVDGVDNGKPNFFEEEILLREAVRIEIYRASLAPPQFNDFDGCGVVLIWTR